MTRHPIPIPLHSFAARLAVSSAVIVLSACSTTAFDKSAQWSPEKLYSEAKEEAAAGNLDKAAKLYERLEGRAAGTLIAQQAQLERAFLLWKNGEKAQAMAGLERFIKLHPTSPALDYAFYLQGLINFNDNIGILGSVAAQDISERDQQASRDAYQAFKRLVEQFPQSSYAEDAQLRMNYIVNALAAYEVHVADYYFRRGAYVAAANRAQHAIEDFQRSPSVEPALHVLVQSYDRLGLKDLRDDAQRVLTANFPKSTFSTAGLGKTDKDPWWKIW